jgi:hypothetical protein
MNLREGTRMVDAEGPEPSRSEPCPQTHIPTSINSSPGRYAQRHRSFAPQSPGNCPTSLGDAGQSCVSGIRTECA